MQSADFTDYFKRKKAPSDVDTQPVKLLAAARRGCSGLHMVEGTQDKFMDEKCTGSSRCTRHHIQLRKTLRWNQQEAGRALGCVPHFPCSYTLPTHLLTDTIVISFPLKKTPYLLPKRVQEREEKWKKKKRKWEPTRKKVQTGNQRGKWWSLVLRWGHPQGCWSLPRCALPSRRRDQEQVPELLGSPSWSSILPGLWSRLCRTRGSPAGWQGLGWV